MSCQDKKLSKAAQSVQDVLHGKGLDFEVVELSSSTRTAQEAANTIGCEVAHIVKSLLFCTKGTHQPVLVLASGVNRVNEQRITALVGEKIEKPDADFVREITGFAIGGIPPIGHKKAIPYVFIDEDLLQYEVLWAAAGTPNAVFSLNSKDLEQLTHGKIVAIK
jgi:prolyl-tRNA editing enzyme YbaK/EbsC (Cys-tRNA(Pro) deacylase)